MTAGRTLAVLDTFAGIGGFSLGLEWTGLFETVGFCEIGKAQQDRLRLRWPGVPIYDDIRTLTRAGVRADGFIRRRIEVITAGFPCQDVSIAGKRAGIEGEQSGLWKNLCHCIGDFRPKYAIVENSSNLLSGDYGRWFGRILGDLAALGYDAEWHCIPASHIGAAQIRDRIWIFATDPNQFDAHDWGFGTGAVCGQRSAPADLSTRQPNLASANQNGRPPGRGKRRNEGGPGREAGHDLERYGGYISDTIGERLERIIKTWTAAGAINGPGKGSDSSWWQTEPDVGRVANGVPNRVDRLACLGAAIVPQMAEVIGYAIAAREGIL